MIVRESEKEVLTVNNFEKLTKGPDALGAFLRTLPVLEGPWDAEFHARFCAGCAAENCDACPHEEFRNNPGWWLTLETGGGQAEKYAVIATYHNGARIGAVVEAESGAGAWMKALAEFNPRITAAIEVSRILNPERGAAE